MPSKNEKRLLLLCSASLLALQFVHPPSMGGFRIAIVPAAEAQEVSCFVAGTMVLMADGHQRPIETVQAG